ncbi:MAG: hypothetical protein QXT63_06450, partial [Thermoplasmata archaeon]
LIKIAKLESHIKVILQRLLEIECEIKELNSIIEERKDEGISVVIRRERRSSKRSKDIRKIERRV